MEFRISVLVLRFFRTFICFRVKWCFLDDILLLFEFDQYYMGILKILCRMVLREYEIFVFSIYVFLFFKVWINKNVLLQFFLKEGDYIFYNIMNYWIMVIFFFCK